MIRNILLLIVTALFFHTSCNLKNQATNAKTDSIVAKEVIPEKIKELSVRWEFKSVEDENFVPRTTVVAIINEIRFELTKSAVGTFSEIEKKEYANQQVPAGSLTACTGYWAGSGQLYVIIKEDNKLVIKEGFWDEQGPREITYSVFKTIEMKEIGM